MKGRLHHVSLVTRDLDRALAFYCDRLGFAPLPRPAFDIPGAWLSAGDVELHLIVHPGGTVRADGSVDANENHFAMRVADFDAAVSELVAAGFREGEDLLLRRGSLAGYGQIYLRDPDNHIIEINAPV